MSSLPLKPSKPQLKNNSPNRLNFLELTVVVNTPLMNSMLFFASNGITHHLSCPHTPQQNGTVERKHRHIIECALTLLSHASLPTVHWTYAITTAIHLINRLPTPKLSHKSPWETLFHKSPDISHLKTFGCICFPLLRPYNSHKLQP